MPPVPRLELVSSHTATRLARRRRRRLQLSLLAAVIAAAAVVLVVVDTAGGQSHPSRATPASPSRTGGASTHTASASSGAAHHGAAKATAVADVDPLTTRAMKRLLAGRSGKVSVAVEDLRNGKEWVLNPGARDQTASIVKADILETLLYQAQERNTPLSEEVAETAEGMIEASDNDDATDLFDAIGGPSGLAAYNAKAGLDQTTPSDAWGETLTSAADQIRLLRQLALPHGVLNRASVDYQLGLMRDIDPGENWGITAGVPASPKVKVALKNGWVPLTSGTDWEVNSIGWVDGDNHDYLIAVLTAHDPSEAYGIDTIDAMSKLIYDTLGPVPPAGTKTITADTAEGPEA